MGKNCNLDVKIGLLYLIYKKFLEITKNKYFSRKNRQKTQRGKTKNKMVSKHVKRCFTTLIIKEI